MNIDTLLNWKISLVSLFFWFLWGNFSSYQTLAQLIPDDTLGGENSLVTPQDVRDLIEGGAIRGDNLFHSFREFNINDGQRVDFANPTEIVNIFTRVTGVNPSDIFGTLGVDGTANLILINPNGISFGANAILDVRGSFFATTADSLVFDNGWEFSATNPEAPPLLTINIPMGLQYGSNPGNINVNQSILEVEQGQSLSLMGGNIQVEGGEVNGQGRVGGQLNAPGGIIELGSITAAGFVGINSDGSFSFPEGVTRGNVSLNNQAIASIVSSGGDGINVNARNLMITGGSSLRAGIIKEGLPDPDSQAGDININTTESVILGNQEDPSENNRSFIQSFVFQDTVGNAGNININTGELVLYVANIQSQVDRNSQGNGGNININANTIDLNGGSIQTQLRDNSQGKAGNININTNYISLREIINVQRSKIQALVEDNAIGDGGNIVINTDYLLLDKARIDASINDNSQGNAGNILIDAGANGSIKITAEVIDSTIDTSLGVESQGSTGNIEIITGSLYLNGQGINTSEAIPLTGITSRLEQGAVTTDANGNITIVADTINLNGQASIESSLLEGAKGDAGSIEVTTNTLTLNGANASIRSTINQPLITETQVVNPSTGTAGNLQIKAQTITMRDGAHFRLSALPDSNGTPGNVTISTNSLELTDGSYISTDGDGTGDAGKIEINATDYVLLSGVISNREIFRENSNGQIEALLPPSRLESRSLDANDGAGGEIIINTPSLQVLDGALIITNTGSNIDAGSISVSGNTLELRNGGQILSATSGQGNAGNIEFDLSENIIIEGIDGNRGIIIQELINNTQARIDSGEFPLDTNPELLANEAFTQFFTISENSGVFASTTEDSIGKGGSITFNSEAILVADSGQVNVSSLGMGEGGEISIFADTMNLDNGQITAETTNRDGGNINIAIANLLSLSNESLISATARNQADGGNIIIDTGFLVALPPEGLNGSDIQANADRGNGGTVNITANGIYGISFRAVPTPNNDITVTSLEGSAGIVELNTPDTNPAEGLDNLSEILASPPPLKGCQAKEEQDNESIMTTRNRSFPTNPYELLSNDYLWEDVESPSQLAESFISDEKTEPIVEAQGWIVNERGNVELVATPDDGSAQVSCGFH